MNYKNLELLKPSERAILIKEVDRCFKTVKLDPIINNHIDEIEISKRLKCTNGLIRISTNRKTNQVVKIKISVAYDLYKEFGFKDVINTLRHEIAHYFAWLATKKLDHCEFFKECCVLLGGTMNSQIAGAKYSQAASANFIEKKHKYRYEYDCLCGYKVVRYKRLAKHIRTSKTHHCPVCDRKAISFRETKRLEF